METFKIEEITVINEIVLKLESNVKIYGIKFSRMNNDSYPESSPKVYMPFFVMLSFLAIFILQFGTFDINSMPLFRSTAQNAKMSLLYTQIPESMHCSNYFPGIHETRVIDKHSVLYFSHQYDTGSRTN